MQVFCHLGIRISCGSVKYFPLAFDCDGFLDYACQGNVLCSFSMFCYLTLAERKELVSLMKDHESSICSISIHASGRHALTTANEIAQIWDLDTFTKKKTLNGAQTVGIQQVQSIF